MYHLFEATVKRKSERQDVLTVTYHLAVITLLYTLLAVLFIVGERL